MTSILSEKHFHDEAAAYQFVEARVWASGIVCPHCGNADETKIGKLKGNSTRIGVHKCYECRKPFTVKVGTIFESSHVALHLWLQAIFLIASSKKGISSNQLHRTLGVTLKTAWFMSHRIREAMRMPLEDQGALGGNGNAVEVDETYVGGKESNKHVGTRKNRGAQGKAAVFSMVQRGGEVRSMHLASVTASNLRPILLAHIDDKSALYTDDAGQYRKLSDDFAHEVVNHSAEEYVRGDVHTNTIESYFSILKRGINGTYHHVSQQHLGRYLAKFDFRYNSRVALGLGDIARADRIVTSVVGKRLTYQTTSAR
jgi:transposase-like protein